MYKNGRSNTDLNDFVSFFIDEETISGKQAIRHPKIPLQHIRLIKMRGVSRAGDIQELVGHLPRGDPIRKQAFVLPILFVALHFTKGKQIGADLEFVALLPNGDSGTGDSLFLVVDDTQGEPPLTILFNPSGNAVFHVIFLFQRGL